MVSVSASVNLPLHHKVPKFSSGTGLPAWSLKKGRNMYDAQEDSVRQLESKTKELEEEKTRLQRTSTTQHSQLDKYKKMSEENQSLADSLETQVSALKKVRLQQLLLSTNTNTGVASHGACDPLDFQQFIFFFS